jgi:hypothetical protein
VDLAVPGEDALLQAGGRGLGEAGMDDEQGGGPAASRRAGRITSPPLGRPTRGHGRMVS